VVNWLKRNTDRNSGIGRVSAVVQVIAVVGVIDVNVVVVVPVIPPIFRPWVNRADPITLILEPRVSADYHEGQGVNSEPMLRAKVSTEPIVRNAVAVVAPTLLPCPVVRIPTL
jgi:hypothetical protein